MKKIYFLFLGLLFAAFGQLYAQTPQANWPVANGQVNTIVRDGNTIYMGGLFSYVGPNIPYGASIDAISGAPNFNYVKPNANINAVAPDGSGGWYIGGAFTMVGGQVRNRIARINADGSLNPWNPDADNTVNSIAVDGNTVYIGGIFLNLKTTTTPVPRNRIAAINATTGDPTTWDPNASANVTAITVSGSIVYVGGAFTTIGVDNRNRLAAIDASTGLATPWNPGGTIAGNVNTIVVSGNTVFVGGGFASATIGGQTRRYLAALNASDGMATSWAPEPTLPVSALVINGNTLYVAGSFTSIDAQPRNRLASFDITNLAAITLNSWNPDANAGVNSLAISGTTVYVGGLFTTIGGQNRTRLAALDASSANVLAWNPGSSGSALSLGVFGSSIYVGGNFVSVGGQVRNGIAAIDATTGTVTSWNPNITSASPTINSIVVNGGTVYFGGNFTAVNSTTRNRAAAVDAATGTVLTSWDPNVNGTVNAMVLHSSNTMYMGGQFSQVNGATGKLGLAGFDLINGTTTSWTPQSSSSVNSLLLNGNTLYVGGQFVSFGGGAQLRNRIASFDITNPLAITLNTWNPNAGAPGNVFTMALDNNILYAGGSFTSMGGLTRNRIAAINVSDGSVTSWDPNAGTTQVTTIVVDGATVYAGGTFTTIGGATRNRIAALNATTGTAIAGWDPNASGNVTSLMLSGNNVFVGGAFTTMNSLPFASLAVLNNVLTSLPVRLLSFNARSIPGSAPKVLCNWETAQEINFSHFIVERSADGIHYSAIGTVAASGDASASHQYSFTDFSPLAGKAYYRLKQVDIDGMYAYSKVVVILGQKDRMEVLLYPNPATDVANLVVSLPEKEQLKCSLFDQTGRMVYVKNLSLNAGSNTVNIPIQELSKGFYIIKIQGPNTQQQLQLIKQ